MKIIKIYTKTNIIKLNHKSTKLNKCSMINKSTKSKINIINNPLPKKTTNNSKMNKILCLQIINILKYKNNRKRKYNWKHFQKSNNKIN